MKNKIKIISNLVLAGIAILSIIFVATAWTTNDNKEGAEKTLVNFDSKVLTDDGQWISTSALENNSVHVYNLVELRGSFDGDISAGKELWFFAENAEITMLINGKQVFNCNKKSIVQSIFHSPGSDWFAYTSDGISKDDIIDIKVNAYYGHGCEIVSSLLGNMFVGEEVNLFQDLLVKFSFLALILTGVLFSGIIYIIEGLIYKFFKMKEGTQILLLGFYLLTGALWGLTDIFHAYLPIVFSPPLLASLVDFVAVLLFPIALMLVVRHFMRGKTTTRIMNYLVLASVSSVLLSLLLQLIGVADLRMQQGWLGATAIVMLIITTGCVASDLKFFKDKYLVFLLLAVLPVFFAISIDSANVLLHFMPRRLVMKYAFACSAVILISHLALYAQQDTIKRQQMENMNEQVLNSRIATLLSQIKPHFLFNTLTSINYLCETDPKIAGYAVTEFSKFLRGNLDALTQVELIPFERELEHIGHYLAIEQLRYGDRLTVVMNLQSVEFLLPSLSLQPIVENAITHGLGGKEEGGVVTISSVETDSSYIIEVSDDGVGFDLSKAESDDKFHIGIENVRNRLSLQTGAKLTIVSEYGSGTTVKIVIPKSSKGA